MCRDVQEAVTAQGTHCDINYMCRDAQEAVTPHGTYCDIKYMCRDAQRGHDSTGHAL